MNAPVLSAALALIAAVCWGAGDFSGGLAARRSDPIRAVLLSYSVGLILVVSVALFRGEKVVALADLGWGALAGLSGMVGVGFLFRGFTLGRMGIVAPISALLGTALPVVFEALTKGLPRELQLVGFGVALVGIYLLARPERLGSVSKGLGVAVLAGLGFGGFFIAIGQIGQNTVFWPLAAARAAAVAALLVFVAAARRPVSVPRRSLWLFTLAGVLDVGGNLFFLLSAQTGRLDVTAVLSSLYPGVTALIAWLALKERLSPFQVLGVGVAILAIVLITL